MAASPPSPPLHPQPENVMFQRPVDECQARGRALRVKLIDLGMAAVYDPARPTYGCLGSPGFIDPTVVNGEPHTVRARAGLAAGGWG